MTRMGLKPNVLTEEVQQWETTLLLSVVSLPAVKGKPLRWHWLIGLVILVQKQEVGWGACLFVFLCLWDELCVLQGFVAVWVIEGWIVLSITQVREYCPEPRAHHNIWKRKETSSIQISRGENRRISPCLTFGCLGAILKVQLKSKQEKTFSFKRQKAITVVKLCHSGCSQNSKFYIQFIDEILPTVGKQRGPCL